jgi:hypothetical protein
MPHAGPHNMACTPTSHPRQSLWVRHFSALMYLPTRKVSGTPIAHWTSAHPPLLAPALPQPSNAGHFYEHVKP